MSKLKRWFGLANPQEKEALAKGAETTIGTLRQAAGGYREGSMKAESAAKIEAAAKKIRNKNPTLPELTRGDLCTACAECQYFKQYSKKEKK